MLMSTNDWQRNQVTARRMKRILKILSLSLATRKKRSVILVMKAQFRFGNLKISLRSLVTQSSHRTTFSHHRHLRSFDHRLLSPILPPRRRRHHSSLLSTPPYSESVYRKRIQCHSQCGREEEASPSLPQILDTRRDRSTSLPRLHARSVLSLGQKILARPFVVRRRRGRHYLPWRTKR